MFYYMKTASLRKNEPTQKSRRACSTDVPECDSVKNAIKSRKRVV